MMLSEEDKNKLDALNAYKSQIAIEGYNERCEDIMACYPSGKAAEGM